MKGRLVFMPQDNVNTDAIYGKDYTYRDDMTPEMMAKVVMENYDPQFAARTKAGDVIVSQFNFGTGSSREQAVTCLKAKGIPLVIAASFSQTYLRNAFNNGFLCIEVPEFVARVREQFAKEIAAKEKTIIPGRRDRYRLHFEHDHLARREVYVPGAGQRAAVAGDCGRSGESGGEAVGRGLDLFTAETRTPRKSNKIVVLSVAKDLCISRRLGGLCYALDLQGAIMAKYTVITMPGDGIGNQVLPESLRVLKAVGFDAEYIHADIGWDCWCSSGNALPDRTIELLTKHKLGFLARSLRSQTRRRRRS